MEKEKEYIKLLKTLIKVTEANKGIPACVDGRNLDAEGFMIKFFYHAASILYLSRATTLPELNISYFDPASINVLARSAFETFLVFHFIFTADSDEEKEFNYYSWKIAGLFERQRYPVQSPEGREQLENEKEIIQSIKTKLLNNRFFLKKKNKCQKNLLKSLQKGRFQKPSWKDIGLSAGLNEIHAEKFYSYLCEYAHTGYLSILQVREASDARSQRTLVNATMTLLMIAMANMIKTYCILFSNSECVLSQETEIGEIVDKWIYVGQASYEDIQHNE